MILFLFSTLVLEEFFYPPKNSSIHNILIAECSITFIEVNLIKHHTIAHHPDREAIAAKVLHFACIQSEENFVDILKNALGNPAYH